MVNTNRIYCLRDIQCSRTATLADAALGYSSLAQYNAGSLTGFISEDNDVEMLIPIECKAADTGPCMAAVPQHDIPAQLVECILRIDQHCAKTCLLLIMRASAI